ncbi:MAG TPA: ATP-binding cassette domain-containing protein [Phycisphaerae bacterium]|nr:ATP-binding cassette domain-containing protein [Phycisphaerae bacterium]
MPEPIFQLQQICKQFSGRVIFDHLDLDIFPGETLVVLGPSGTGKSTLLRVLTGYIKPDSGRVLLRGKPMNDFSEHELSAWMLSVGMLFQSGALFNSMTLRENLSLPVRENTDLPEETIEIMAKIYLQLVGLREHIDKLPGQLSGGMKKRGGLARELMMQPRIMFYDEPTAGLDPVSSRQIAQLIMDLNKKLGVTGVVVTHDMQSAFHIADRMVLLHEGKIGAAGAPEDFLTTSDPYVRQFVDGLLTGPMIGQSDLNAYEADILATRIEG